MQREAEEGVLFDVQYRPPVRPKVDDATSVRYVIVHTDGEAMGALWGAENGAAGFIQTSTSGDLGEAVADRWRDRILDAYLHADKTGKAFDAHQFINNWSDRISGIGSVSLEGPYEDVYGTVKRLVAAR